MARIALASLLLLQILSATYATFVDVGTLSPGGIGLHASCKQLHDTKFCLKLLRPYASQFDGNDNRKMGHAAISATLSRAQAARAFMIRQITEPDTSPAHRAALEKCLNKVGSSVDSLRQAAREFNDMEKADGKQRPACKKRVVNLISASGDAQKACYDLMNGAEVDGEIVKEVRLEAGEAVEATVVAKFFVK